MTERLAYYISSTEEKLCKKLEVSIEAYVTQIKEQADADPEYKKLLIETGKLEVLETLDENS